MYIIIIVQLIVVSAHQKKVLIIYVAVITMQPCHLKKLLGLLHLKQTTAGSSLSSMYLVPCISYSPSGWCWNTSFSIGGTLFFPLLSTITCLSQKSEGNENNRL